MSSFLPSLRENLVRAFVHEWYATWDANHPDPEALLALIAPDARLALGEVAVASEGELRQAYSRMLLSVRSASHHVLGIRVGLLTDGAEVQVQVLHQREAHDGSVSAYSVRVTMRLRSSASGPLQVVEYATV